MSVDWDGLQSELSEGLQEVVSVLLESGKDDLKEYGQRIANLMVEAVREGRHDLREELVEASALVLELNRIRATNEQKRILETILHTTFRWLLKVATGVGL